MYGKHKTMSRMQSRLRRSKQVSDDEGSELSAKVLAKLKHDGQFDKLRHKITERVRNNEKIKNYIISKVDQSMILNTPGAENKKPRELFDAIHDEIKNVVQDRISEAIWQVIESKDGLGKEIEETVESVYFQLTNRKQVSGNSSLSNGQQFVNRELRESPSISLSGGQQFVDWEQSEPPGFSICSSSPQFADMELRKPLHFSLSGVQEFTERKPRELPGFSSTTEQQFTNGGLLGFSLADDPQLADIEPQEPPGFCQASDHPLIGGESMKLLGFSFDS